MAQIGAKDFYWNGIASEGANTLPTYAASSADNYGGVLVDLVQVNVTLNYSEGEAYADDKLVDSYRDFEYADVAIQNFDVPLEVQAVWFGGDIATNVLSEGGADEARLIGFGLARTLRKKDANGQVKTVWRGYYYPKASPRKATSENSATRGNGTNYNYDEYTLRAFECNSGVYRQVEDFTTEAAFVTWIKGLLSLT